MVFMGRGYYLEQATTKRRPGVGGQREGGERKKGEGDRGLLGPEMVSRFSKANSDKSRNSRKVPVGTH